MDTFFTGLLLAMMPFITIVLIAFILQKKRQKTEKDLIRKPTRKQQFEDLAKYATLILAPNIKNLGKDNEQERVAKIWEAINRRFQDPKQMLLVNDFAKESDSQSVQRAFEEQLSKAFLDDSRFAEEINKILQQEESTGGTIIIGNANTIYSPSDVNSEDGGGYIAIDKSEFDFVERLAGDETTDAPPPEKKRKSGKE